MVALVVPNAALARIVWTGGGRTWQNVLGLAGNPGIPVIDQTLADTLSTAWGAQMSTSGILPLLGSGVTFTELGIRDISVANRAEFTSNAGEMSGTGTGDLLPLSVAAVATLRTAGAGKSFRGRVYFSGWTEAQNDPSGRALAAVNTAIRALLDGFNAVVKTHGLQLGVVSRPQAAKTIPQKVIAQRSGQANPIVSVETRNTKWESQRRRTGRT